MQEPQGEHSVVFFDLETTGLGPSCDIVQLAAVSGGHSINLYVLPQCPMQRGAAKVTGFQVHGRGLYLHHQRVLTNTLREVLVSFIAFLRMLGRPLVVGHNIRRFDCPLLTRALERVDLRAEFDSSISGCVDTLPLAREVLKGRGVQSFRQEHLLKELLGVSYQAHDALQDVRALQTLYSALQPSPQVICRHTFTLDTTGPKPAAARAESGCQGTAQRPLCQQFRHTLKMASIVFFDLETTGLNTNTCHLTQLSAVCGQNVFNVYVLPKISIEKEASDITGLTVSEGVLCHHGNPVETSGITDALTAFIGFLRSCGCPWLAAHNARCFDLRVLTRLMRQFNLLQDLQAVVRGCVDTLPLSRMIWPDLPRHSQAFLVERVIGQSYPAHNGVEDAKMLQALYGMMSPSQDLVSRCTFNII